MMRNTEESTTDVNIMLTLRLLKKRNTHISLITDINGSSAALSVVKEHLLLSCSFRSTSSVYGSPAISIIIGKTSGNLII